MFSLTRTLTFGVFLIDKGVPGDQMDGRAALRDEQIFGSLLVFGQQTSITCPPIVVLLTNGGSNKVRVTQGQRPIRGARETDPGMGLR